MHWPGTISLMPATMTAVIVEVGRWVHASGFRKLVIVNGHATNGPPCQSALLQLRYELPDLRPRFVSLFDLTPAIAARYAEDAPDFHANEAETSMLLHLAPGAVEPDAGRAFGYSMTSMTWSLVELSFSELSPTSKPTIAALTATGDGSNSPMSASICGPSIRYGGESTRIPRTDSYQRTASSTSGTQTATCASDVIIYALTRSAKSTASFDASPIRPSFRSTDSASCIPRSADCSATLA